MTVQTKEHASTIQLHFNEDGSVLSASVDICKITYEVETGQEYARQLTGPQPIAFGQNIGGIDLGEILGKANEANMAELETLRAEYSTSLVSITRLSEEKETALAKAAEAQGYADLYQSELAEKDSQLQAKVDEIESLQNQLKEGAQ